MYYNGKRVTSIFQTLGGGGSVNFEDAGSVYITGHYDYESQTVWEKNTSTSKLSSGKYIVVGDVYMDGYMGQQETIDGIAMTVVDLPNAEDTATISLTLPYTWNDIEFGVIEHTTTVMQFEVRYNAYDFSVTPLYELGSDYTFNASLIFIKIV